MLKAISKVIIAWIESYTKIELAKIDRENKLSELEADQKKLLQKKE